MVSTVRPHYVDPSPLTSLGRSEAVYLYLGLGVHISKTRRRLSELQSTSHLTCTTFFHSPPPVHEIASGNLVLRLTLAMSSSGSGMQANLQLG